MVIANPVSPVFLPSFRPICSFSLVCHAFCKDERETARHLNETHWTYNHWLVLNRYVLLSNCNRILIFRSYFSTIPRKISEYLPSDFPSSANTRKIRDFYKLLNINELYLRGISPHCKKHHFVLRNGPFQRLKSTISHPKMGLIAPRNRQYRKAKCIISD